MTHTPDDVRYTKDHMWARSNEDGTVVRVGISDFAQESLGDVVAIYLPKQDQHVDAGEACGEVESTKSDNDLVSPVTGVISSRHERTEDEPELVNQDPYGEGWLWEVTLANPPFASISETLLDASAYRTLVGR